MGTRLGPMFANTSLIIHEVTWREVICSSCPMEFKPKTYRRYLDDTFILFKNVLQV